MPNSIVLMISGLAKCRMANAMQPYQFRLHSRCDTRGAESAGQNNSGAVCFEANCARCFRPSYGGGLVGWPVARMKPRSVRKVPIPARTENRAIATMRATGGSTTGAIELDCRKKI
jgi:hypothetical protein